MLDTPVLFMIFNRPNTTAKVFEEIRKIKPKYLFIAADGPRADRQEDAEKCEQTRKIATQIDWPCQVKTLFRERNMGCGLAPAENITWFFTHVEEGIILEDDCVPHPSFFSFCENLLSYYRDNLKVFQISGDNFQHGQRRGEASYYFSKYTHICGWATWRSRWQYYDFYLKKAEEYKNTLLIERKCTQKSEVAFWHRKLEMLSGGKRNNIWDYQWMFACWNMNGLSAVSNVNLISNIGFGSDATHTVNINYKVANLPVYELDNIRHVEQVEEDRNADYYTFFKSGAFFVPSLKDKIRWKIKSILPQNIKLLLSKI